MPLGFARDRDSSIIIKRKYHEQKMEQASKAGSLVFVITGLLTFISET